MAEQTLKGKQMQNGIYSYPGTKRVVYGIDMCDAVEQEIAHRGAQRVLVLASATLARETEVVNRLVASLGSRCAGVFTDIGAAHAAHWRGFRSEQGGRRTRRPAAGDRWRIGHGRSKDGCHLPGQQHQAIRAELDALRVVTQPNGDTTRPSYKAPSIDSVIIPTTLSAGEFSAAAGCTDTRTMRKESYVHPDAIPGTVILDPAVTVHTPSGCGFPPVCAPLTMRWKTLCAINSMPFSDGTSRHALYLLGKGLRQVKADPSDLAARLDCQLGAWMSIIGTSAGVRKGASHGIGHVLGGPPASRMATHRV